MKYKNNTLIYYYKYYFIFLFYLDIIIYKFPIKLRINS